MPLRLLLTLAGGLLLWLAFPGIDAWPAAPVGVALLSLGLRQAGARRGFVLGLAGGLACFLPLLSWTGIYVGPFPWVMLCLLEALYVGLLGLLLGVVRTRPGAWPWYVGAAWVSTELLRATTPYGGFPWGRLAFSQSGSPYGRLAALAGAPGVTFAVALTGGYLALAVLAAVRRAGEGAGWRGWARPAARLAAAGAAPALVALLIPLPVDGTPARIMAIQGNVPQAGLDFNAQRRAVLDNHVALTRQAAERLRATGERRPDLVLWPENASDIDPLRNDDAARAIAEAVADLGSPVVVGAVLSEPTDHVTNAALLYLPGATTPSQRYDKRHPVPFAEYIPQRAFFRLFSDKVDLVRRDFVGGSQVGVLRVPRAGGGEVAAGANICFEVAYDDLVRDGVRAGANLIVVQTNNATFGDTHESVQQLAVSRLRAIEHGRSVVHISNVGVSSLISPDGTLHGWTGHFQPAILAEDLPLRTDQTLATRLGDLPAIAAAVVTAGLLGAAMIRRRART